MMAARQHFRILSLCVMLTALLPLKAQGVTLKNCGLQVNYGEEQSGESFRPIAIHGLAVYEILAALNIHDRTAAIGGVNRSSVQYQVWAAARGARRNISRYHLPDNVLTHLQELPSLAVRTPTVSDIQHRKAKLFFGGYYQGFDPKTAAGLRSRLHDKRILTFVTNLSCRAVRDRSYQPTVEDILADIAAIAQITGQSHIAEPLIAESRQRLARVKRQIAGERLRRVFYYAGGLSTPYGVERTSVEAAILRAAGAEIIGISDRGQARIGWRDLQRGNLDAVLIPFDGDSDRLRYRRRIIEEKIGQALASVKVIVVYHGDWQPSPAAVFAVEDLAAALYPNVSP